MIHRLWIMSELYFPEETSTGYVMTKLAEALAADFPVSVLCGQPTYSARGTLAPPRETRNDVEITRCSGLKLDKDVLWRRLANMATLSASIFVHAFRNLTRDDLAIVVTNPPALPFLVAAACRLRGARCLLLIHDVYPEAPIASGLLRRGGLLAKLWARATSALYRRVSHICVIGRDMADLVAAKCPGMPADHITIIPNWAADEVLAKPASMDNELRRELGIERKFVVEYAGNMGKVHDIECLVETARRLERVEPTVHFLFIGAGAKRSWLVEQSHGLSNVTILPARPRSDEPSFLRAGDVAVMAFVPGMAGVGVPSRLYNILAAGRPVIAAVDSTSEPALVIDEEKVGWLVTPGDAAGLASAILAARADPSHLAEMGLRAISAVLRQYTLPQIAEAYRTMIERAAVRTSS
jgi:colanic acid biosynthesis glycosyl transferase WcaI